MQMTIHDDRRKRRAAAEVAIMFSDFDEGQLYCIDLNEAATPHIPSGAMPHARF
jgi:hypothetical protein